MPPSPALFRTILTATLIATHTGANAQPLGCPADCDGDRRVAVAELVTAVNILLERADLSACMAADTDMDERVSVGELVQGVNAALSGCPNATPSPTAPPTATPTIDRQIPPSGGAALLAWLEAGSYLGWQAESESHTSVGPHFGAVRTFVNDALFASLDAGEATHPLGAAAVKELYGSAENVLGWAVSLKVDADSNGGVGWYWYERFGSAVFADAVGAAACTGCHSGDAPGITSKDFVLIPFPLQ